jgi:3-hydroxyacyl-[acyl-carrier-protein] dehydratase
MSMRFRQIDEIIEIVPGEYLVAKKTLTGDEDYLLDHFPLFPVMPGVLMLEGLFQSACWLIRATEEFKHTVLMLKEIRNAKFADFLQPGQSLTIRVEIQKHVDNVFTLKATGTKDDHNSVSARLIISCTTASAENEEFAAIDENLRNILRDDMAELTPQKTSG